MVHHYKARVKWTGNKGDGTSSYDSYSREHVVSVLGKKNIDCSSDPHFKGEASLYNPEELLLISLSSCHMLWYLHLCADHGIIVEKYEDFPEGRMETGSNRPGRFILVTLKPHVWIKEIGRSVIAARLHEQAHLSCFISNSCNFPVVIDPVINEYDPAN